MRGVCAAASSLLVLYAARAHRRLVGKLLERDEQRFTLLSDCTVLLLHQWDTRRN